MSKIRLKEHNIIVKDLRQTRVLVGYCYPSTYRAGMTGLATHLFYEGLNGRGDTSCERYFRYDVPSPVRSLETARPLKENHIVAFSLTWEEDILNLLQMLDMGGIETLSENRGPDSPVVLVGGPVVSANPEPFTDFVDAFVIGEGDLVIHDIVDTVRDSSSRSEALVSMREIPGVYVPSADQSSVKRLIMDNLDDIFHPVTQIIPDVPDGAKQEPVFGKSLLVEVTRGCGYSCKFCMVGHICRPRRARSLDCLKRIVEQGLENTPVRKVSLIGSSLGDLDGLEGFASWVVNQNIQLSAPSLRADSVTLGLLEAFVKGGQRTLTIAPEAGSDRMRRAMGKGLDDEEIDRAARLAAEAGYRALKLYFIIGLPDESEEDIIDISRMVKHLSQISGLRITASINPFVPKAHTRWERESQPKVEKLREKFRVVQKGLRDVPRVEVEGIDPRNARIQAALSVGDRSIGRVIHLAARYGGLGGWRRAEKESGLQFLSLPSDTKRQKGKLPWSFLVS
ncbi:MAG: B12-binding domain-containing radical SAM protein [Candidatus Thorarchaeota archaeon]